MILERLALAPFFTQVVAGDSFPYHKPDPRTLLNIVNDLGATAHSTVLVGDSEIDAATAQAAQVPFVLMTYGYRRSPLDAIERTVALTEFSALIPLLTA
jgi:phosphoglycolate phosphatase